MFLKTPKALYAASERKYNAASAGPEPRGAFGGSDPQFFVLPKWFKLEKLKNFANARFQFVQTSRQLATSPQVAWKANLFVTE